METDFDYNADSIMWRARMADVPFTAIVMAEQEGTILIGNYADTESCSYSAVDWSK